METIETHVMQPAQNWALHHLMQLQAVQVLDVAARERPEYAHASACPSHVTRKTQQADAIGSLGA
jgi:hypothetical protein